MSDAFSPTISVIMPAFRAAELLPKVLPPLLKMLEDGEVSEVIVVDDQSPDNTAELAAEMGAKVLVMPENGGPGAARNFAAEHAIGDVLWLVDSDVIAQPGGPAAIRAGFAQQRVEAVFGRYDDKPEGSPWYSRYKNLMHRFYHGPVERDASSFWAGCGAITKQTYLRLGGFDVDTYKVPSIEDIEFGNRIYADGGRIRVMPDLQGKHLKVWTISNGIFTDIFRRALPWSRLMIARSGLSNDLNVGWAERFRAGIAGLLVISLLALPFAFQLWWLTLVLAMIAIGINWTLLRFFVANGGVVFAAKALS
ncbi:MAG: glycosyltransferase, partial [Mangrovicoccus sp.]